MDLKKAVAGVSLAGGGAATRRWSSARPANRAAGSWRHCRLAASPDDLQ
jgi:hypothetical protein